MFNDSAFFERTLRGRFREKVWEKCEENRKGVAKYNTRHHFEVVGEQSGPTTNPLLKG